jgi:hypothetical protein
VEIFADTEELKSYKDRAIRGINELENYQKQSPFLEYKADNAQLNKWRDAVKKATLLNEIDMLNEEIIDKTGYDILIEDDEDEDLEEGLDTYSLLEAAEDNDRFDPFAKQNSPHDDIGSDYDDDFDESGGFKF